MIRLVAAVLAPVVALLPGVAGVTAAADPAPAAIAPRTGVSAPPAPSSAAPTSLEVAIDSMSPAVVPRGGPLRLTGTVTNTTDEPWTGVNMHPFLSYSPMRTASEIEVSAESDPDVYLGPRILTPGAFDTIEELAPGASATWQVQLSQEVLRGAISGTEGVYWVGVHALGADTDGRDAVADGRARTFISLVGPRPRVVQTSIVVPVRERVRHLADGRLADATAWEERFAEGGRLRNILDLAETDGGPPVTWAIDPAVLAAARQVSRGNPPRSLGPTVAEPTQETPEPAPDEDAATDQEEPDTPGEIAADAWLTRLIAETSGDRVLAMPYGDLDVAAAARKHADLYTTARELSDRAFASVGISAVPAVAPPTGTLSTEALARLSPETVTLVADSALPERLGVNGVAPATATARGHGVEVYDAAASRGGPLPGNRTSALALRQRVLAAAAVRSLDRGTNAPLVVSLPHNFDPGADDQGFFAGIQQPFVRLAALGSAPPSTAEVDELAYGAAQRRRELAEPLLDATQTRIDKGLTLERLLADNDQVADVVAGEALAGASYLARGEARLALSTAQAATTWVLGHLARIDLDAPSFVILSSESGPFAVTISNGLDQPVSLKVEARTAGDLVIRAPERIDLGPNSRQTVNLRAESDSIGVHSVELVATDTAGTPLGAGDEISIRSNKVGRIIWVVLGVGVGILFVAIVLRLGQRIRRSRAA